MNTQRHEQNEESLRRRRDFVFRSEESLRRRWNFAFRSGILPHDARIPPEMRGILLPGSPLDLPGSPFEKLLRPKFHQLLYFGAVDQYQQITHRKGTANFSMDRRWIPYLASCLRSPSDNFQLYFDFIDAAACWKVPERIEKCTALGYNRDSLCRRSESADGTQ